MKNKKGFVLSIIFVCFILGVSLPLFMINHKKVKADTINDLTNTTWVLNSNVSFAYWVNRWYINFSSNNTNYTEFYMGDDEEMWIYYNNTIVYSRGFINDVYKTISITGGTDVTNASLISFLQNNATQQQPTPTGTQILYKYWSPYGSIVMQNNDRIGDENIQYIVLYNEFTDNYDETTQTGLYFLGVQTSQTPSWSYIESINGTGINILYHGESNIISNAMWLEFTYGDYMDSTLYDFMDLNGYWFDDADAYIVGMNQGYAEGISQGRALGQADGVQYTNLITTIFNGLGNVLSIQVFPNITIALLIGLPLLLGAFIIIIKILRG